MTKMANFLSLSKFGNLEMLSIMSTYKPTLTVRGSTMRRFTLFTLSFMLVLGFVLPAFAQDQVGSVNTGSLNVRTGPGLGFGSVATLPFGFGVQLVARNTEGNWVLVQLTNGVNGWVNKNFLFTQFDINSLPISDAAVPATVTPTATVTGALNLNLRNGPSTDNAIIATIPLNERVVLLGRNYNSTWAQVRRSDGTVGWAQATALTATVPVRGLALADGSVFVPFAPSFPGENTTGSNPTPRTTYVIAPGDTLSTIAERFGINLYTLAAVNNIYNYDLIYFGQQIIIPG